MRVAIIGSGYVGLTTGVCCATLGHDVACVDLSPARVAAINRGEAPFFEPDLEPALRRARAAGTLHATTELASAAAASDLIIIAVGTPPTIEGIDLSQVIDATRQIAVAIAGTRAYQVIVVKSTVVPGTTEGIVRRLLEEGSGRRAGDFGLCKNPEFLREGSAMADFMNPDRIVIGQSDERAGAVLDRLYEPFRCPRVFTTLANAEAIKYASNALLATLVSFSNEMAAVCEATPGTDVREVLRGVHLDRRLSPVVNGARIAPGILDFLRAGSGFGGSCLPKDVHALRSYARTRGVTPHLLDAVTTVNVNRPAHIERLAEHMLGTLEGRRIAVLGLAFKAGTDDLRESPTLAIIGRLLHRGVHVTGYDPILTTNGHRPAVDERVSLHADPAGALEDADAAIIGTACPEFAAWDWRALCGLMRRPIVVDGRNALEHVVWPEGAQYVGIGVVPGPEVIREPVLRDS